MNLPDWATHVAVDGDGQICAFEYIPKWVPSAGLAGAWTAKGRSEYLLDDSIQSASRLLCVAIPRPERKEEET